MVVERNLADAVVVRRRAPDHHRPEEDGRSVPEHAGGPRHGHERDRSAHGLFHAVVDRMRHSAVPVQTDRYADSNYSSLDRQPTTDLTDIERVRNRRLNTVLVSLQRFREHGRLFCELVVISTRDVNTKSTSHGPGQGQRRLRYMNI